MSRPVLLRALLALVAVSALVAHAPAQHGGALSNTSKPVDPRIDLATVPRGASSMHHIRQSGSYYFSKDVLCGAGLSGVTIDAAATSVVIDFNGFAIVGNPLLTSIDGLNCLASPARRTSFAVLRPRIYLFGGQGMSISSCDSVVIRDATVMQCTGDAISLTDSGDVDIEGAVVRGARHGTLMSAIQNIRGRTMSISNTQTGVGGSAGKVSFSDLSITKCTADGISLDDNGLASTGTVIHWQLEVRVDEVALAGARMKLSSSQPVIIDNERSLFSNCGGAGVDVSAPSPSAASMQLSFIDTTFSHCGDSAVRAITVRPITCRFGKCVATDSGAFGMTLSGSSGIVVVDSSSFARCASGGMSFETTGDSSVSVSSTQVSDCGGDGLQASTGLGHGKVSVQDISFSTCSGRGMSLSSGGTLTATLSNGHIEDCGSDGARASGGGVGKVVLQDIHFARCTGNGFSSSFGGGITLECTDSSFVSSGAHGVQVSGGGGGGGAGGSATLSFARCVSSSNQGDGCNLDFSSSPPAGKVSIQDFHFVVNNGRGCFIDGISSSMTACSAMDNGSHGFEMRRCTCDQGYSISSRNGGSGVSLYRAFGTFSDGSSSENAADGFIHVVPVNDPPLAITLSRMTLSHNGGFGIQALDKSSPKLIETCCNGNAQGGSSKRSSSSCSGTPFSASGCTFDSNGGRAIDVSSSLGGRIERCSVSSSNVGIYVGDVSGQGCSSGVSITDCTVTACATGIDVSSSQRSLVIRNAALQCAAPYQFTALSLCGPVVTTSQDLAVSCNPNANYVQ